jgi:hypothetical protein
MGSLFVFFLIFHLKKQIQQTITEFEVLTALGMKVAIFLDIQPCSTHMNQRFGGTEHLHLQGRNSTKLEASVLARGDIFLHNFGSQTYYTALHRPRRCQFSN